MKSQRKMIFKKGLLIVLTSLLFLGIGVRKVWAQTSIIDRVNLFDSEIRINKDSSISIKETIYYETNIDKHGIYRYVPVNYKRGGWAYTVDIEDVKITDEKGKGISFSDFREGGNRVFKIGEADKTFVGKKTYVVEYKVEGALHRFEEHDELYWDITGEGWKIPVEQVRARIYSPHGRIEKINCFSGLFGANDKRCEFNLAETNSFGDIIDRNECLDGGHLENENCLGDRFMYLSYNEGVDYGDNVTVLIALSKDTEILWPTKIDILRKWIEDNFFVFLIPLPALLMFVLWFLKGRDWMFLSANVFNMDESRPKKLRPFFYKHRVAFVYEPIKELTPGEAGLMLDERVDNQDVIAEILDLARKKYLKIERIKKKKLFGKKEDYKFLKLKGADKSLPGQQEYLMESIFTLKDEILLSELKGTFYTKMEKVKKLIRSSVKDKKLFVGDSLLKRFGFMVVFSIFSIGSFFFTVVGMGVSGSGWSFLVFLIQFIAGMIMAYHMPQKTAVGTNLMLQAKGLMETIKVGKWREEIKEKNLFIEEVLPFAVALGVIKKLAKDMEGLNIKAPEYFSGTGITAVSFSNMMNSFSAQASSGLSYNPNSSSSSGGSGFSSGGGFSGGGGGGGGGGSW